MRTLFVAASVALAASTEKERPLEKVISLLRAAHDKLQAEGEGDEAIYNKFMCWVNGEIEANEKVRDESSARIEELENQMGEDAARIKEAEKIAERAKIDVQNDQEALNQATDIRNKELEVFNEEHRTTLDAISALNNAMTILKKHQALPQESLMAVAALVDTASIRNADSLTDTQQKHLEGFIQAPAYNSNSGQIFGILGQMLDDFKATMASAQSEEDKLATAFAVYKEKKLSAINENTALAAQNDQIVAELSESNAKAMQERKEQKKRLKNAKALLEELNAKKASFEKEFVERSTTRGDEIKAVAKAIEILTSDESLDAFTTTFNRPESFLQVSSVQKERMVAANKVLSALAQKTNSAAVAKLVSLLKLADFTDVKKAIDGLIKDIQDQIKADKVKKDTCREQLAENEKDTALNVDEKKAKDTKLEKTEFALEKTIENLKATTEENEELAKNRVRTSAERSNENLEFQQIASENKKTIVILQKVKGVLMSFYAKKSLIQQSLPGEPMGFSSYKKQSNSGGALKLMDEIINDTKLQVAEALQAEQDSQKGYEEFMILSHKSIKSNEELLGQLLGQKGTQEADIADLKTKSESLGEVIDELANAGKTIHLECDFYLKNYDIRQQAMTEEIEALRQAKQILSGATFSLLQKKRL